MSAASRRHSSESFARLVYERYEDSLLDYLRRNGIRGEDQWEALQDVITDAWRKQDTYNPAQDLKAWLFGIAANVVKTYHRRRSARAAQVLRSEAYDEVAVESIPDPSPGPEENLIQENRRSMLERMVSSLGNESQRKALVLHEIRGLPLDDVAKETGASPKTVWARCEAARERCKAWLQRWQANERSKGRDGMPPIILPLFTREHAERRGSGDPLARREGHVLARVAVALLGLGCTSPALTVERPIALAPAATPVVLASPTPRPEPARVQPSPPRIEVAATAPRRPEPRAPDTIASRHIINRAEAEFKAGHYDQAIHLLMEHKHRFPEGPLAEKRNSMIREATSK